MASLKNTIALFISLYVILVGKTDAAVTGCSADKQRCINSCMERHRSGSLSFVTMNLCKGRCLLSECVFYPRAEKKSLHPSDNLKGFAI
nr:hypothetical protein MACL_00002559 [Theileria orientalis]